ncbi:hypothetical protein KJ966_03315 [bacterium]|nr:hypothetical protein [bacterium]
MKMFSKWFFILGLLVLPLVMSCGSSGGSSGGSSSDTADTGTPGTDTGSSSTSVILSLDFSALASSASSAGAANSLADSEDGFEFSHPNFDDGSATYFTGTVTFVSVSSGAVSSYDITAGLDSAFDAVLTQAVTLSGGQYTVSVTFSGSGQQYFGETSGTVTILENSSNSIAFEVHPVIGNTIVTGSHTNVPFFDFQYAGSDFASDYTMTVTIDGAVTVLTFDEFTGAVGLYINTSEGTHNVVFEVKNSSGTVVARYQNSNQTFTAGSDLTLDLRPIFGTSTFTLTESGGDATFDIRILDSAYDAVNTVTGGNFEFRFLGSGANNTIPLETLDPTHDIGNSWWLGTQTYTGFQFDTMTCEVVIWDTSEDKKIGGCTYTVTLSAAGSTDTTCDMTLDWNATIDGKVLQALGVNVVDSNGAAVPAGTVVYVDGIEAGLTGDTDASSDNFTVIFLQPDTTHDIYAETAAQDSSSDSEPYFAESWKVDNILLWLN